MIVTFEQAIKLEKLGFDEYTWRTYNLITRRLLTKGDIKTGGKHRNSELCKQFASAPTISEALDYLRGEKGIACGVSPDYNTKPTGKQFYAGGGFNGNYVTIVYKYVYEFYDDSHERHYAKFDTHTEAESALLDELLIYINLQQDGK